MAGVRLAAARPQDVAPLLEVNGLPSEDLGLAPGEMIGARDVHGALVGCAGVEYYGEQSLLRSLAVESEHRSLGVGGRLVAAAVSRARHHGSSEMFALTTTAAEYLERFGFLRLDRASLRGPIEAASEFRCSCPQEALVLVLRLSHDGPPR